MPVRKFVWLSSLILVSMVASESVFAQAPDTSPPTVSLTSPAQGAMLSGIVTVSAAASDNVGVVGVQFTAEWRQRRARRHDRSLHSHRNTAEIPDGPHVLTAVARDAAGNQATTPPRNITVNDSVADTTAPTVSLTAPASVRRFRAPCTVARTRVTTSAWPACSSDWTATISAPRTPPPRYSTSWNTTGRAMAPQPDCRRPRRGRKSDDVDRAHDHRVQSRDDTSHDRNDRTCGWQHGLGHRRRGRQRE